MSSTIDPSKPTDGVPAVKGDLRSNLNIIRTEINHGGFAEGFLPTSWGAVGTRVIDHLVAIDALLAEGVGGGAAKLDPDDDGANYSTTPYQLTEERATSGLEVSFTANSLLRINVEAGISENAVFGFNIFAGLVGQIESPATVFINGVAGRSGSTALQLAPGAHILRRRATSDHWLHTGPTRDADLLFWGMVGGQRIREVSRSTLSKEDSGHWISLIGNPAIPTDHMWNAILYASGGTRTISHSSFRAFSTGLVIASPFSIASGSGMTVVVRGGDCYLMGL